MIKEFQDMQAQENASTIGTDTPIAPLASRVRLQAKKVITTEVERSCKKSGERVRRREGGRGRFPRSLGSGVLVAC